MIFTKKLAALTALTFAAVFSAAAVDITFTKVK